MAVEIEIIDASGTRIKAAFYYVVPLPQQLVGANDQARVPAGSALSAQELQDLKDGTLYEKIVSIDFPQNETLSNIGPMLVSQRSTLSTEAGQEYSKLYTMKEHVGRFHDGLTWS